MNSPHPARSHGRVYYLHMGMVVREDGNRQIWTHPDRVELMARTAEFDPIVVEPRVTADKVRELVERRMESAKLDYKLLFNPNDVESRFRLHKHIMAMGNTAGGYIVVGIANDFRVVGLDDGAKEALDESRVRASVAGATAVPVPLFVDSAAMYDGLPLAIITVLPVVTRIIVAAGDGQYTKDGKPFFAYRKGAVLVRHGSASEPWNQDDADYLQGRVTSAAKTRWREDFGEDLRSMLGAVTHAPKTSVGPEVFDRPPAAFRDTVIDLLREPNE